MREGGGERGNGINLVFLPHLPPEPPRLPLPCMRVERPKQSFFSNWAGPFAEVTKDLLTVCFAGQGREEGTRPGFPMPQCTAMLPLFPEVEEENTQPAPGEVGSQEAPTRDGANTLR